MSTIWAHRECRDVHEAELKKQVLEVLGVTEVLKLAAAVQVVSNRLRNVETSTGRPNKVAVEVHKV